MNYLLDTHIAVWAALDSSALPKKAAQLLQDPAVELYISTAAIWEASIKGATRLGISAEHLCKSAEAAGYTLLDISAEHAIRVATLPPHHHDPFDRMMLAQALTEGFQLVTADSKLHLYGAGVYAV
ncbi:PIN domain-containing protein [Pseudomonas sp. M47T1]|uniref:type II toxin-antitoxin system VapC family toxin n=1 Tax=Pseudomonas sp. M47T1 TaxID=1179778 RepID=UPI0002606C10|nr:type II toxin-antitoxin system VapC family toxin [Pseudomonas sp. M47T1]EIK95036.1 PIN domain-containing protein [Pseudomonas sp. M47T1]